MENDVLRGKIHFSGFVCVQMKSLTLSGEGKENFITISRKLCIKNFKNSLTCFHCEKISLFVYNMKIH